MGLTYESEFVFIGKGDESFLENYSYEMADDPDEKGGRVYMALEVLNNQAEAEEIGEKDFIVKVKEPPVDGRANAAVIIALAGYFNVPPSSVNIISGHTSRQKIIEISGI